MRFGTSAALVPTVFFSLVCLSVVPGARAESESSITPDTVAFIGPRMQVDTPVFDFGQVEQGDTCVSIYQSGQPGFAGAIRQNLVWLYRRSDCRGHYSTRYGGQHSGDV